MRFLPHSSHPHARRLRRSLRRAGSTVAAALLAVSTAAPARADTVYWDVNGTTAGSGVSNATVDWINGNLNPNVAWDGTLTNWNDDSTGGAGGTPRGDIGAGNTGVFAAGSDAGVNYVARLPDGANLSAGGLTVNQGNVYIPGDGNSGQGGPFGGSSTSIINIGSTTFNVDVATGTSMTLGFRLRLASLAGSAVVNKTSGGVFNLVTDVNPTRVGNIFTGKYNVSAGTMGVFFGGNTMLGSATTYGGTFVSDQLTVSNNATIKTLQQNTSVSVNANEGITIGSGGATFFFAGAKDLDPAHTYTTLGSIQIPGRITGGAEGARVPITIMSNTLPGNNGIGQSTGTTVFNFGDNSSSTLAPPLYAKWIVKSGELGLARAAAPTDVALGAVPASYLADAITLDGGYLRPNANCTVPANRGITLGAAGGGLHPVNAITFTIDSIITGAGQLRVYVENNASGKVVLTGANNYTGGTVITGVGTNAPQGTLQGDTTSLQGPIANGSKLVFDQTFTGSYAGSISGTGTLAKSSTGTFFLTGSNTYTGTSTGNGGVLIANSTSSLPGYNVAAKVIANSGGAVGISAGGGGQWTSGDIDTLRANATYNNGSSIAFNVDSSNSFTYASNITPANSVGLIKLGAGTLTLSGNNTYAGPTDVRGGTLVMTQSFRTSSALQVADGAKAELTPRNSPPKVLQVGTLTLNSSGTLDLNDNDLVVDAGIFADVQALVFAGFRSSPDPGATGIVSTTSQNDTGKEILALFDNSLISVSDWPPASGNTVAAAAVVGKYTYFGDVSYDGQVTGDDYAVIDANLDTDPNDGVAWLAGDASLDGVVTGDDYTVVDANLGNGVGDPLAPAALVPEPGTRLLMLGAGLILARRRRQAG